MTDQRVRGEGDPPVGDSAVNEANAYSNRVVTEAKGTAATIVQAAQAYREQAVRDQVGALMAQRLHDALGSVVPDEARMPLVFMLTGGLLNAGMGYLEYAQVAEEMAKFADSMPWKKKRA